MMHLPKTILVPAWRLFEEGDIDEAYSADRIMENRAIRPPFRYGDALWVSVGGLLYTWADAYQLARLDNVPTTPVRYRARLGADHGATARADPLGFYHGVLVSHAGVTYVLKGPPTRFITDPSAPRQETPASGTQFNLFTEEKSHV